MSSIGEKSNYTSFILWDIDYEFQKSYETYEQWLARHPRRRRAWQCFSGKQQDDELGRALCLGRKAQSIIRTGRETFGSAFERGDSASHSILSAQLIRIQQELYLPLLDCTIGRTTIPIPYHDLLTTARSIRRICHNALRDQYSRLQSPTLTPFLPPPRFSVKFCPFALELQKNRTHSLQTKKARRHDRHDDREVCPHCYAHLSVTAYSGLPEYRRLLFQYHQTPSDRDGKDEASYACTSCYKTFNDPYGFLDHLFQKELGSERSCQRRWSSAWNLNQAYMESNPALVEKCLKNCWRRELQRVMTMKPKEVQ